MKIALYHNLTSGGSKREAYEFARQFAQAGHYLDLYIPQSANETFLPLEPFAQKVYRYPITVGANSKVRFPGLTRYFGLAESLKDIQRIQIMSRTIAEQINQGGYDFVFVHHEKIIQSPFLLRYLAAPSVYYCAEPMRIFYEPPIQRSYDQPDTPAGRLQRAWYRPERWISRQVIRSADRANIQYASLLVTNSYFSAESIYRAYGLRARVVYLGVDTVKFKPDGRGRADYVLSVGAIHPLKGYDFLIQSLGTIPANQRPRLVIVGNTASTGEKNYLTRLANQYQVQVQFEVNIDEDALVEHYNRAAALVYTPVMEPFGLAPIEAMACGLPVVGVCEGGVRESVINGETGLLTQRVPEVFGGEVCRVLADNNLRQHLTETAIRKVNSFWNWPLAYERFQTVIDQYLHSRS